MLRPPEVAVLIGAGAIGQAIARRVATGKTLPLADINETAAQAVSTTLTGLGFQTRTAHVDVSSRESVEAVKVLWSQPRDASLGMP